MAKNLKTGISICITSAKGGVGKTTTVLNLAGMYELMQKKVLLIDLDLTNGGIALSLNKPYEKSISTLFQDINNNKYEELSSYVTKYDDYQCFTNADNKQTTNEQQTDNMQKTNGQQTNNKRTTTNKNEKNIKNDKNNNNLYCSSDEELKINQIINTVIEILNIETDKKFSPDTKLTRKLIQDRLNDGYGLEDFKRVIEKKCDAWKSDPVMESYLKPSILFGPKFDEYLNE